MEEKKVTMSGQTATDEKKNQQSKPTYEQLMQVAQQLNQQCQALERKNYELESRIQQMGGAETRLHFLFKILENKSVFDTDYIIEVADEVKDIMAIKNEEPENKGEDKE